MKNIIIITIDTLRYDSYVLANTRVLDKIANKYSEHGIVSAYTMATFTLPVHVTLLYNSTLPRSKEYKERAIRRPEDSKSSFAIIQQFDKSIPNSLKKYHGFTSTFIGGVGWFDNRKANVKHLFESIFDKYYWDPVETSDRNPKTFENQIDIFEKEINWNDKNFVLLNIPMTHPPMTTFDFIQTLPGIENYIKNKDECKYPWNKSTYIYHRMSQIKILEFMDQHFQRLFDVIPPNSQVFLMADHGHCFRNEDGISGHGFYHPKVMEVPLCVLDF